MKRFTWLLITLVVFCLVIISLAGCVSKSEYEALQAEQATLTEEKTNLTAELQDVQSDLTKLQADYEGLQADYDELSASHDELSASHEELSASHEELNANYEELNASYDELSAKNRTTERELAEIKEVYPPRDFNSITELEDWVSKHIQPETPHLEGGFRSALKVQAQGLEDGYLISVMYDEDDTDPDTGWIFCGALVNGHLYIWNPEVGEIHSWYADWLVR